MLRGAAVTSYLRYTDSLVHAVNLECLEAAFYQCAVDGKMLSAKDLGYADGETVPTDAIVGCTKKADLTPFGRAVRSSQSRACSWSLARADVRRHTPPFSARAHLHFLLRMCASFF